MREEDEVEDRDAKRCCEGIEAPLHSDDASVQHGPAEVEAKLNKPGKQKNDQGCYGPIDRATGKEEPPKEEQEKRNRFDQAAAQIVEDLPARDGADRVDDRPPRFVRHRA